jgi:hypothetical protein
MDTTPEAASSVSCFTAEDLYGVHIRLEGGEEFTLAPADLLPAEPPNGPNAQQDVASPPTIVPDLIDWLNRTFDD